MCRAIFRWLTAKNLYTIMFDSQLPGSPEALIMAFKDGKVTYAKIFECLATCVHIMYDSRKRGRIQDVGVHGVVMGRSHKHTTAKRVNTNRVVRGNLFHRKIKKITLNGTRGIEKFKVIAGGGASPWVRIPSVICGTFANCVDSVTLLGWWGSHGDPGPIIL